MCRAPPTLTSSVPSPARGGPEQVAPKSRFASSISRAIRRLNPFPEYDPTLFGDPLLPPRNPNVPFGSSLRFGTVDLWPEELGRRSIRSDQTESLRLTKLEHFKGPRTEGFGTRERIVCWLYDVERHYGGEPADPGAYVLVCVERFSNVELGWANTATAPDGSVERADHFYFPAIREYEDEIKGKFDLVQFIELPKAERLNLLDLIAILETVSKAVPHFSPTLCLWFAGTVFDVVCNMFDHVAQPETQEGFPRPGTIGSVPVYIPRKGEFDVDAAIRAERLLAKGRAAGPADGQIQWGEKQEDLLRLWVEKLPPLSTLVEDSREGSKPLEEIVKLNASVEQQAESLRGRVEQGIWALRKQTERRFEAIEAQTREQGLTGRQAREQEIDAIRAELAHLRASSVDIRQAAMP